MTQQPDLLARQALAVAEAALDVATRKAAEAQAARDKALLDLLDHEGADDRRAMGYRFLS